MSETPLESPGEDVAEQRVEAFPEESDTDSTDEVSLEADPADAQEQAVEVPLDEEAWR